MRWTLTGLSAAVPADHSEAGFRSQHSFDWDPRKKDEKKDIVNDLSVVEDESYWVPVRNQPTPLLSAI